MVNAVILWTTARIYKRSLANTNKKKRIFKPYTQGRKELDTLIEKKSQKFIKTKKRRKAEKELQHFSELQISDDKVEKSTSSMGESIDSGEISSPSSE